MKHIVVAAMIAAFALYAPLAFADTSTAPGQQKKEAGAQSAKEYAPGQQQEHGKKAKPKRQHEKAAKGEKSPKQPDVAAPAPERGKSKK